MEEWERRKILGDWGVGAESAQARRERLALERDAGESALRGEPVRPRPLPFHRRAEGPILAAGGPRPYMVRLRAIEELTREHERALEDAWRELARTVAGDAIAFAEVWESLARRCNFSEVNDLIDRHNRYYPEEARLPMDVRRRDFALVNGEPYDRRALDARWVLDRFPADLYAATVAA
jgi:hypothetical protein